MPAASPKSYCSVGEDSLQPRPLSFRHFLQTSLPTTWTYSPQKLPPAYITWWRGPVSGLSLWAPECLCVLWASSCLCLSSWRAVSLPPLLQGIGCFQSTGDSHTTHAPVAKRSQLCERSCLLPAFSWASGQGFGIIYFQVLWPGLTGSVHLEVLCIETHF